MLVSISLFVSFKLSWLLIRLIYQVVLYVSPVSKTEDRYITIRIKDLYCPILQSPGDGTTWAKAPSLFDIVIIPNDVGIWIKKDSVLFPFDTYLQFLLCMLLLL